MLECLLVTLECEVGFSEFCVSNHKKEHALIMDGHKDFALGEAVDSGIEDFF